MISLVTIGHLSQRGWEFGVMSYCLSGQFLETQQTLLSSLPILPCVPDFSVRCPWDSISPLFWVTILTGEWRCSGSCVLTLLFLFPQGSRGPKGYKVSVDRSRT